MNSEFSPVSTVEYTPFPKEADFLPKNERNSARPSVRGVTIDRRTSYDLDDAFSIEPITGGILLSIHISDVASVVPKGSQLDTYAKSRITSRYRDHYCLQPMFPRSFTKEKLSLLPGQRRPTVSIQFPISYDMEMESPMVALTTFKNKRRFDYGEINDVVNNTKDEYSTYMTEASRLAYKLSRMRRQSTGIFNENTWGTESWKPVQPEFFQAPKEYGQGIVNEFMLLANIGFLRFCYQHEIPILYRNHAIHVAAGDTILAFYRREKLSELKRNHADYTVIYPQPASYHPDGMGHFGMNRNLYGSFSSPGRKFSDLVNQRNMEAFCKGEDAHYMPEELVYLADHINNKTREKS